MMAIKSSYHEYVSILIFNAADINSTNVVVTIKTIFVDSEGELPFRVTLCFGMVCRTVYLLWTCPCLPNSDRQ